MRYILIILFWMYTSDVIAEEWDYLEMPGIQDAPEPTLLKVDTWTYIDTLAIITSLVPLMIDYGQTRYLSKHWDQYPAGEENPYLGMYPTTKQVNVYFTVLTIANLGGYYIIHNSNMRPHIKQFSKVFLTASVFMVHGKAVAQNHSVGVKVNYPF